MGTGWSGSSRRPEWLAGCGRGVRPCQLSQRETGWAVPITAGDVTSNGERTMSGGALKTGRFQSTSSRASLRRKVGGSQIDWDWSSGTGNGMVLGQFPLTSVSHPGAGSFPGNCARQLEAHVNSRAQVDRERKLHPARRGDEERGGPEDKLRIAPRWLCCAVPVSGRARLRFRRPGPKLMTQGFHGSQRVVSRRLSAQGVGELS